MDLRYIDVHQLDADPVYCISIVDNYSRAILASALSRRQDLSAFLVVLYAAVREYGSPTALVSDGGSIFKATRAKALYAALGLRHERIGRRKPWQSYIETTFNIQRRMADDHFARATTWVALQRVPDRWVRDYNEQLHWAHQQRDDGRRTPREVLGWVVGRQHAPEELAQLFQPVRYGRRLDQAGYVRFRRWRVYGERALAQQAALVWLSEETLTVATAAEPLAYYTVQVDREGALQQVTAPRLLPTAHAAPQPPLWAWTADSAEWLLALQVPRRGRRRRRPAPAGMQGRFTEQVEVG